MLVLEDMKRYGRSVWDQTLIRDAMRPVTTEQFVETTTTLVEANQLAATNGCGAVGVIDQAGRLVGVVILKAKK
jgi:predicted transcriptional regulator